MAVDPTVLSDHGALKYSGDPCVCCCQLNMDLIVSAVHSTISDLAEPVHTMFLLVLRHIV